MTASDVRSIAAAMLIATTVMNRAPSSGWITVHLGAATRWPGPAEASRRPR